MILPALIGETKRPMKSKKPTLTYTQTIVLGFLFLILGGAVLLSLPISSRAGKWTPFADALFTATSATCVTGLVLYDTYTHWSTFGQVVIMFLIQIGGVGFMTVITVFSIFLGRKMGLHERQLLMQSSGMLKLTGIVGVIKRIALMSLAIQAVGAVLLATRFVPQMGLRGIYFAIFHAVASFCQAGFELMGRYQPLSSLTLYADDPVVILTVILLVVIGGVGFIVWDDIWTHKLRLAKYTLHSKIALTTTAALVVLGWVLFYLFEMGGLFAEFSRSERAMLSLFQSITPRTAGFNIADTAQLSGASVLLTMIFMIIGGSSGSTSGGVKVTTFTILVINAINSIRKTNNLVLFKRKISDETIKNASALICIYLFVIVLATLILAAVEPFGMKEALFESISAVGTVGLSLGVTQSLSTTGKIVITLLMFAGRVGLLTLLFALVKKHPNPPIERPVEKVLIG